MPSYVIRCVNSDKEIKRVKLNGSCSEHKANKLLETLENTLDLDKYWIDESEVFDYFNTQDY